MAVSQVLLHNGVNSVILNPSNDGQGSVNGYLGKAVRVLGRAVWSFGSCSIGAICGVAYHGFRAIDAWLNKQVVKDHLAKFNLDLCRLVCTATIVTGLFFSVVYLREVRLTQAAFAKAVHLDLPYSKIVPIYNQLGLNVLKYIGSLALGLSPFFCPGMRDPIKFAIFPNPKDRSDMQRIIDKANNKEI